MEEYERLQQFREEQLLRTLTNPKVGLGAVELVSVWGSCCVSSYAHRHQFLQGSFGMSIDATEVFDRYTDDEDDE